MTQILKSVKILPNNGKEMRIKFKGDEFSLTNKDFVTVDILSTDFHIFSEIFTNKLILNMKDCHVAILSDEIQLYDFSSNMIHIVIIRKVDQYFTFESIKDEYIDDFVRYYPVEKILITTGMIYRYSNKTLFNYVVSHSRNNVYFYRSGEYDKKIGYFDQNSCVFDASSNIDKNVKKLVDNVWECIDIGLKWCKIDDINRINDYILSISKIFSE
jgi:hypothetical protein